MRPRIVRLAIPVLAASLVFQLILTVADQFRADFGDGEKFGAPFPSGVGRYLRRVDQPDRTEVFSVELFLIDVIITAGITLVIALFLRLRETWAPSAMAFPGTLLVAGATFVVGIPPVFGSIAFTVWICWLLGFTSGAAFMTALDLSGRRASPG